MVGTVVIVGKRKDKVSAHLDRMFRRGDKKRVCVCACAHVCVYVSVYMSDNDKSSEEKSKIRDKE